MSLKFDDFNTKWERYYDEGPYLDRYGVRITPPCIEFKHAFEARTYKQKLSIQNIGSSTVLVRLTPPTSFACKIKCVKGQHLPPGLSIVREVTYVHTYLSSSICTFAIYIDEKQIDYYIFTRDSISEVSLTPTSIDFGLVDENTASLTKILVLQNDGSKPTRFYVDARNSMHKIIADPHKGMLQPRTKRHIHIKLVSSIVGSFSENLWITCDKTYTVPISGEIVVPKFQPMYDPTNTDSMVVVDFPPTYVGLSSAKTVYVKNYSASESVFCVLGEVNHNVLELKTCLREGQDFKYFDVLPKDGMWQSKEVKVFNFRFKPVQPQDRKKLKPFYFCIYHITRIMCRFLISSAHQGDVVASVETFPIQATSSSALFDHMKEVPESILVGTIDPGSTDICIPENANKTGKNKPLKIYLHGVAEQPSVTVIPDELDFSHEKISIGECQTRILEFRNNSTRLPIIVNYRKAPHVNVEKERFSIEPTKSFQISIFVTPNHIGVIKSRVYFDLLYYDFSDFERSCKVIGKVTVSLVFDTKCVKKSPRAEINQGLAPNYIKDVGKFCQEVKLDGEVEVPKCTLPKIVALKKRSSDALIALPNDTQRSLRPWRGNPKMKTPFTKMPRYIPPLDTDYEMTVFGRRLKMEISNYYTSYTRKQAAKLRASKKSMRESSDDDYDLKDRMLWKSLRLKTPSPIRLRDKITQGLFIPLTPAEMSRVIIDPMIVDAGRIATHSRYDFELHLKNQNCFPLRFNAKSEKSNVMFPDGNKRIVKAMREVVLPITYLTSGSGYHTTSLDVIVNDCTVYGVTIVADVVQPCLDVNVDVIEFVDEDTRFIEITNPLNKVVRFRWATAYDNFQFNPSDGLIKPKSKLACEVRYFGNQDGPSMVDADLFAGDLIVYQIKLNVRAISLRLNFASETLLFADMPLNMPVAKKAMLKNYSAVARSFSLLECDFLRYAEVNPMQGIVYGKSYSVICITLKIPSCVEFSTRLKFLVSGLGSVELGLEGNVVYPNVVVHPTVLTFRIPSSTVERVKFFVENHSKAVTSVKFDMTRYDEYKITETIGDHWEQESIEELMLEKHSSKILYMHFIPRGNLTDKFFLPININYILGSSLTDCVPIKTSYFLKEKIPDSTRIEVPGFLPVIKIDSYSNDPKLKFSAWLINLDYKIAPYLSKDSYNLKISNILKEEETFCIRTDKLLPPFYMTPVGGKKVVVYPQSLVCSLSYQEEIVLNIRFKPDLPGCYRIALPVFLKSESSAEPHNTLCLSGIFETPTITTNIQIHYYKPAPTFVCNMSHLNYDFNNHFPKCTVRFSANTRQTEVEISDSPPDSRNKRIVSVKLTWCTEIMGIDYWDFTILCTCGASCSVMLVECRENCFLTNYAQVYTYIRDVTYNLELKAKDGPDPSIYRKQSLMSVLENVAPLKEIFDQDSFFASYPFFPSDDKQLSAFMIATVSVVEDWVYTQGFFGRNFYKISTGICYVLYDESPVQPPFIQLLINLAGDRLKGHFQIRNVSSNQVDRVMYLYDLYQTALKFLESLGAYLAYISPELLMEYTCYMVYVNHCVKDQTNRIHIPDRKCFILLAKQAWLDLLLQTYKVLVLNRLLFGESKVYIAPMVKSLAHQRYTDSIKNLASNKHLFSNTELLLLSWLQFHYNDIRARLWSKNSFLEPREITWYGENMEDGFVYAAVTLAYCPFVAPHFEDLYRAPSTDEELFHNCIKVVQCWHSLNFSFKVTPTDIAKPHPMKTLFIIVYLYQLLPNMYPTEVIEFEIGLSTSSKKYFVLKNVNNFPIAYKAILYGNEHNTFETDHELYVVQPKKSRKVTICYWAKFMKNSQCTLILSGECKGYKYANSIVITLIGKPDVQHVTASFDLTNVLYRTEKMTVKFQSPYLCKATYQIQFTSEEVRSVDDLSKISLHSRSTLPEYFVTRLSPVRSDVEFDENGEGSVEFYIVLLTLRHMQVWLFFRNPVVGDFCVKINTRCQKVYTYEPLTFPLPPDCDHLNISRKKSLSGYLQIPCQNRLRWNAIIDYYSRAGREDDEFWKRYSRTSAGMHILQRILKFAITPYGTDFCQPITYTLAYPKNCGVKFPKIVKVNDQCSPEFINVPIEIPDSKMVPSHFCIILEAAKDMELRHYRLKFVTSRSDVDIQ